MPPRFISVRGLAPRQNLPVMSPGIAGQRHWRLPAGGGHDQGHDGGLDVQGEGRPGVDQTGEVGRHRPVGWQGPVSRVRLALRRARCNRR